MKFGNGNRRWYIIGLGMFAFIAYMFVAPKLTGFKGRVTPTPLSTYIPDQLPFGADVAPASIPAETEMTPVQNGMGPTAGMRMAGAGYASPVVSSSYASKIIVT